MCIFLYNVYFEVNYHCLYGSSIYIVGNIPELGNWDVQNSFKLSWNKKDDWKGNLLLKLDHTFLIYYKYVVGYDDGRKIHAVRWEEGPPRILTFKTTSRLLIKIHDIWEYRRFIIRVKKPNENSNTFYICGNCEDLGNWQTPQEMEISLKKTPYELYVHQFWERQILIPVQRNKNLMYSLYQYDAKGGFFLAIDKKRKVEINFETVLGGKAVNLWQEDLNKGYVRKKNSLVFRSPNLFKNSCIDFKKKKLEKLEAKYNFWIVYDSLEDSHPIFYKINEKISLGNNILRESDLKTLKQEHISKVFLFQKIQNINILDSAKEDNVSYFSKKEQIQVLKIHSNEIISKNKQSISKWAGFIDELFNQNEVIIL